MELKNGLIARKKQKQSLARNEAISTVNLGLKQKSLICFLQKNLNIAAKITKNEQRQQLDFIFLFVEVPLLLWPESSRDFTPALKVWRFAATNLLLFSLFPQRPKAWWSITFRWWMKKWFLRDIITALKVWSLQQQTPSSPLSLPEAKIMKVNSFSDGIEKWFNSKKKAKTIVGKKWNNIYSKSRVETKKFDLLFAKKFEHCC
jgi:hypothetical protein